MIAFIRINSFSSDGFRPIYINIDKIYSFGEHIENIRGLEIKSVIYTCAPNDAEGFHLCAESVEYILKEINTHNQKRQ